VRRDSQECSKYSVHECAILVCIQSFGGCSFIRWNKVSEWATCANNPIKPMVHYYMIHADTRRSCVDHWHNHVLGALSLIKERSLSHHKLHTLLNFISPSHCPILISDHGSHYQIEVTHPLVSLPSFAVPISSPSSPSSPSSNTAALILP
jgi:hypothetical protein